MRARRKLKRDIDIGTAELIVDVAEQIIEEKGIEGFRLQDIADAIGIQFPSLYTHFKGKKEILSSIIDRAIKTLAQDFIDTDGDRPDVLLKRGVNRQVINFASKIAQVRLLLLDFTTVAGLPEFNRVAGKPGALEQEGGALRPMLLRLDKILRDGHRQGLFNATDATVFFHTMLGTILVRLALTRPFPNAKTEPKAFGKLVAAMQNQIEELSIAAVKRDA